MFRYFVAGLMVSLATVANPSPTEGQDIGFVEKFALSDDRAGTLSELVPGTDSYYFFHCLHFQNTQQFDRAMEMLNKWGTRRRDSALYLQAQHRQSLLTYADQPEATIDYLIQHLKIKFNHQRRQSLAEPGLATVLDQSLIGFKRLNKRALSKSNLDRYEDNALYIAAQQTLTAAQRRSLLKRAKHPAIPGLVQLIAEEFKQRNRQSFGSYPVHQMLTIDQLTELSELVPNLKNDPVLVEAMLVRLRPGNDVIWQLEPEEHVAYLDRLWDYVQGLDPSFNSLKANVLYRRLELDRKLGVYDKQRLIAYLKLPRNLFYVPKDLTENVHNKKNVVDLRANYQASTNLAPVESDEPLVRDYLHHFLVDAQDATEFKELVKSDYLNDRLAEAKITAGLGDAERWASMLSATEYRQLQKRIDIEFAHTNPSFFSVDDPVQIKLVTKNIENLIVKVFEINTANFYRNQSGEIDTDIKLDGLVPNWQQTYEYDDAPALRVERTFDFDELKHRGVFVIDFIGNGKSSRFLVRKGQLHHVVEMTSAGHVVSVLNEKNELLKDASLWIKGRRYQPDEHGKFTIPFTNRPGTESLIMEWNGVANRSTFQHLSETYQLQAGIFVDRESLVRVKKATVMVRPRLAVNGQPVPVRLLEKPRLVVRATDLDGVEVIREFSGMELAEEFETTVEILVPDRLTKIRFDLHAEIESISQNKPVKLVASRTVHVNGIDRSGTLQAVHLKQNENGYVLAVLGKTGELRKSQSVQLQLKHRMFSDPVVVNLQSDAKGQIVLGRLKDIVEIKASLNGENPRTWFLADADQTTSNSINASTNQDIMVPCDTDDPDHSFVLTELRGSRYFRDHSDKIQLKDGLLTISPLPAGDYELRNQKDSQSQKIRVTEGEQNGTYVLGKWRLLEVRNPVPLHIKRITATEDKLRIELDGDGSLARVHVLATRYQPRFSAFNELARVADIEPMSLQKDILQSGSVAGRSIGEEYQYILERQLAARYPGNMLNRPSLLLNPWDLRTTENNVQTAARGDEFAQEGLSRAGSGGRDQNKSFGGNSPNQDFANLNFLAEGSVVLANLATDEKGVVEIPLDQLGDKHMVRIVAQNAFQTIHRSILLPESELKIRDLRLANGLDPERHFAQQKQYTLLKKGDSLTLEDITSARFQTYDDLEDIYRYYVTLTNNPQLIEFGFLMNWPEKSDREKRELYKRFACHELNFFLAKKDPDYFQAVVVPYLANKLDKTFLDQYLLQLQLKDWVQPWEFQRLNTVEQILLGRREDGHRSQLSRLVGDDYDNHPTSRRTFDRFYDFAVLDDALQVDGKSAALAASADKAGGEFAADLPGLSPMERNESEDDSKKAERDLSGQAKKSKRRPSRVDEDRDGLPSSEALQAGEEQDQQLGGRLGYLGQGGGGGRGNFGIRDEADRGRFRAGRSFERRKNIQQFYQHIKPTQEWVENNYYRLPIEQQNSGLVRVNRFWREYALHTNDQPFLSPFFPESSRSFTEMMLALAVIDLPFKADEHQMDIDDKTMTMTPASDLIAFYEQVKPSAVGSDETNVLISENFFRADDRHHVVDGQRREKFVRKEFLANVLYGGQIVITNPTATPQEIDLLVQIPEGALPSMGSRETRTQQMDLAAFRTETLEFYFYFPTPGDFDHFPAHVSVDSVTVASADGMRFNVVSELSEVDTTSWAYLSQNGTDTQVLDYLESANLQSIDLAQIAFRMNNQAFFERVTSLLAKRFAYDNTLWSYALKHNLPEQIQQYLKHQDTFVSRCGTYLDSPLLDIEPVIRHAYQHREYWPLVNARAHQLGARRKILNPAIWRQYDQLLQQVARQHKPDDQTQLKLVYYLLLQDRIGEAIARFDTVAVDKVATRIQYDYCAAYLAMYREDPQTAAAIAARYADYPVKRWNEMFAAVTAQVDEIKTGASTVVDPDDQIQQQTAAASKTPEFDFVVESLKTKLNYQNLSEVTINYYQMDIELLFSRNPFVQRQDDNLVLIKPNASQNVPLPADKTSIEIDLPESFRTGNVLVEVVGGGKTRQQAYYANTMNFQLIDQYGQLKLTAAVDNKPLSKVYVKVYSKKSDGTVHFYKDGYTDLRGRFDYASLSNQTLGDVQRFAILVISPEYGAVVREAKPPKQ